jgi:hypothetical protein
MKLASLFLPKKKSVQLGEQRKTKSKHIDSILKILNETNSPFYLPCFVNSLFKFISSLFKDNYLATSGFTRQSTS